MAKKLFSVLDKESPQAFFKIIIFIKNEYFKTNISSFLQESSSELLSVYIFALNVSSWNKISATYSIRLSFLCRFNRIQN